jgi:hypothetical protein
MMRRVTQLVLVTLFLIGYGIGQLRAQTTAQITGTITDAQDAAVPGATVVVTSVDTSIAQTSKTNALGVYTVSFLKPGPYRIDISATGFRPLSRTGVVLEVAQTATLNFRLQVGANVETVTVSDATPLLNVSSDAIGGVVEPAQVENLPMLGRNSNALMVLEPGVVSTRQTTDNPVLESHYQFFSMNGSRPNQSKFTLDGGNDTNVAFNGPEYTPQVEEVQEYRTQTSSFGAEAGNSAGGIVNIVTKAGTNEFHGSLFEYLRNDDFSANDFFSNRAGSPRPMLRYNQFGGTLGGPIIRKRLFFFFAYEGLRQKTPDVVTTSVPTDQEKSGDFSQLYNSAGQLITIYDPSSTIPDPSNPGQYIRTAFPYNKIPQNRIDPVAASLLTYFPASNQPGSPGTDLNNFFFSGANQQNVNNYSGRGDYQLSAKTALMGRYSLESLSPWVVPATFGKSDIASPGYVTKPQHHPYVLAKVIQTFTPSFLGEFHVSWTRWFYQSQGLSNGFDPTKLGFPSYLSSNSITLGIPSVCPGEMSCVGGYYNENDVSDRYEAEVNMTKAWTKHSVKFGGTLAKSRYHMNTIDNSTGAYSSNLSFTQGPNPLVGSAASGFGFASFLLGTMSSGQQNVTEIIGHYTQPYFGFYAEDDVRVGRNLTATVGVRWDHEDPRREAHNMMSNFDFNDTATLSNGTTVIGGLEFPGVHGIPSGQWNTSEKSFSPRVGLVYALGGKTVLRGGYGMFFGNSWGNGRNGGSTSNSAMPQQGFFCTTSSPTTLDNGLTPYATYSDPFPGGNFCQATGSSAGLLTNLGAPLTFIDRNYKQPYLQAWNFNIQRALPGNSSIELAYSGSKGTHLVGTWDFDQLNPTYLNLGSSLNDEVPNPYYGVITSGPLATPTITRGQSLRPYPQFTDVNSALATYGSSSYNALFVTLQRRLANGFSVSAAYTWSKLIDNVIPSPNWGGFSGSSFQIGLPQNYWNPKSERSVSGYDIPQTLVMSYIYQLPVGKGKPLLNKAGVVDAIVGGWQVNGLTTFQSGTPVEVYGGNSSGTFAGQQRPNWSGKNPTLHGDVTKRLDRYFDTSQFSYNAPFTFGNAPRLMPDLFQPGIDNWNMSLFKVTDIHEALKMEFRAEAFNTFNRVQFGPPDTTINDSTFGQITWQQNSPRTLQLGLRFLY